MTIAISQMYVSRIFEQMYLIDLIVNDISMNVSFSKNVLSKI